MKLDHKLSNIQKAPPIVNESPYLYSSGELTPSSDGNSFFKEGGNSENKEPSNSYKSGISSIVSLVPKKLVSNGEQIVKNQPSKSRVREHGKINDLNPKRLDSEIETASVYIKKQ